MGRKYSSMDGPLTRQLAGPLVGGGVTQVGSLATKLIWKDTPKVSKWAPAIGFGLGGIVSGILAFRPTTRDIGLTGLVTSLLMALPTQIENLMMEEEASVQGWGGLGVITPEMEQMMGLGQDPGGGSPVQLLDSGSGSTGLGVTVPEQGGMMGATPPVELLGIGGAFGSNFQR